MALKHFTVAFIALVSLPASLASASIGTEYRYQDASSSGSGSGATAANVPSGANTSENWSGFVAANDGGSNAFNGIGANWTVPQATASSVSGSLSADATWVGIGGMTSHDLIQAGTQTVFQNRAAPSYQAWYELLPADSVTVPLTVHPGDAVTVSIAQQSAGEWAISFNDTTTGQSYTTEVAYQSSLSSADWVEEMPSASHGFVSLDNFGTVSFTDGYAIENGEHVSISNAGAQAMTMINGAGQVLANASVLGSDGASFSVARTSVSAASSPIGLGGYGTGGASGGSGSSGGRGGRWSRIGVGIQGYVPTARAGRGGYGALWRLMAELQNQVQGRLQVQMRSFRQNWEH